MRLLMLLPVIKWLVGSTYCLSSDLKHLLVDQPQPIFANENDSNRPDEEPVENRRGGCLMLFVMTR